MEQDRTIYGQKTNMKLNELTETYTKLPYDFKVYLDNQTEINIQIFKIVNLYSISELQDCVINLTAKERAGRADPDYGSKVSLVMYLCNILWNRNYEEKLAFIKAADNMHHDAHIEKLNKKQWIMKPNITLGNITNEYDEVIYQLEADDEERFLPEWVRAPYKAWKKDQSEFIRDVKKRGQVILVNSAQQKRIGNTGDSWEDSNWKPESKERVERLFKDGEIVDSPFILVNNVGQKWLLGGHHRLTYCTQVLKEIATCWGIHV